MEDKWKSVEVLAASMLATTNAAQMSKSLRPPSALLIWPQHVEKCWYEIMQNLCRLTFTTNT